MRTYKLTISYDGSRYQGWQRQATTDNTIQFVLEWSIGKLVGYRVRVDGSGRTDAGVHARGQVASVKLSKLYDPQEMKDSLNRYLPEDIRIVKVELVRNGFHARKSAKGKKYEYYIDCREKPDVFSRRYCYHYPEKLDIEAMREAVPYLLGPKNFTSFTDDKDCKDPIRKITNIKIVSSGEKVRITFYGTGFLYHMARILTGTLLEIGTGKREASMLPVVIAAEDRSLAGFLAPARGLFLRKEADADIFCIQETKMQEGQLDLELDGYEQYWNYAVKKGYSGTAVFTKERPLAVTYGMAIEEHDQEGRVITLEYEDFYFVTVYTPNSQSELARLDYRMTWEDDFLAYLKGLEEKKPVVFCGDLNVAHKEIDLKNPKTNRKNAGFTDEERGKFTDLLAAGFTDTFRYLYPDVEGIYSWWSYRFSARAKNAGWRIDYFCVSDCLKDKVEDAKILTDVMGSDHCPIELDIAL